MRVLILGAGASLPAGYPLAGTLMSAVERYSLAQKPSIPGAHLEWAQWCRLRDGDLKKHEYLLGSPNPEVVLSALDIFGAAKRARETLDNAVFDAAKESGDDAALSRAAKATFGDSVEAKAAIAARNSILRALHEFLLDRHRRDVTAEATLARRYMRSLLESVEPGDVVITFNWDALAERTLHELGHWTHWDGYGFKSRKSRYLGTPTVLTGTSNVKVLKLHGSVGWYWDQDCDAPEILLDAGLFLPALGCRSEVSDEHKSRWAEIQLDIYTQGPAITYPTYLKTIAGEDFSTIWYSADRALEEADRIEVYGYSLPPSDGAARALLNKVRHRITARSVDATVVDPSEEVGKRWEAFWGQRVRFEQRALGSSAATS